MLLMGNQRGRVDPNPKISDGGRVVSFTLNQHFAPGTDRATVNQAAAEAQRVLQRGARNLGAQELAVRRAASPRVRDAPHRQLIGVRLAAIAAASSGSKPQSSSNAKHAIAVATGSHSTGRSSIRRVANRRIHIHLSMSNMIRQGLHRAAP